MQFLTGPNLIGKYPNVILHWVSGRTAELSLRQPGTTTGNDRLPEPFSMQNPFSSLRDRRTMNEEEKKFPSGPLLFPKWKSSVGPSYCRNITFHGPTNPAIRDWANTPEKLANREIYPA
jgi:hypothetical protein